MGIADLFRPKHRHSDVRVRTEAVRALTADDAAILIQIARADRDIGVRRLAIERITTAEVLAEIAAAEQERSLRELAGERAAQLWLGRACGDDAEAAATALSGIIKLGDQRALVDVVVRAEVATIRKRAFGELRDPRALCELAKSDAAQDLRTAAVARIDDGDVLRALAIDTTQKEVGLAAVDKLDDVDRLEHVAQKAKTKAVRQRARKIVAEIEEAERAKKPGIPDDVKRRRAEKAQLIREVDGVVDSFEYAKAAEVIKTAEAAWAKLPADDGDERFVRTAERFWRRKEIHDHQSRTADELRAVEREAKADKERAAAERAAKAMEAAAPVVVPEEAADDPARLAREAEAKARREEKDRLRAEEDARRQALAAERAARQKEDAERGAAIGVSLAALCDDMEGLSAQPKQDSRAIDRLLAQAAKAFEQIGKVPGAGARCDRGSLPRRARQAGHQGRRATRGRGLGALGQRAQGRGADRDGEADDRGAGHAGPRQPAARPAGAVERSRPDAAAPIQGAVGAVQDDLRPGLRQGSRRARGREREVCRCRQGQGGADRRGRGGLRLDGFPGHRREAQGAAAAVEAVWPPAAQAGRRAVEAVPRGVRQVLRAPKARARCAARRGGE